MLKLSKSQIVEKEGHASDLGEKKEAMEQAVVAYNEAMATEWRKVEAAIQEYNDAVTSADEWRAAINSDQASYFDDRSERWQAGEKGEAYSQWKDQWEEEFEKVEVEKPDDLEIDPDDIVSKLNDDLMESPEG